MDAPINQYKHFWIYLLIIILISSILYMYKLGSVPLCDPDEARYALMSKGMVERNDWLVPYLEETPHPDKPPLFNWLVAESFQLFGINEFSARLISALMAIGTILLAYLLGTMLWNTRTGLFAAIILITSLALFVGSRMVTTDMTLTFFTTLAISTFLAGLIYRNKWYYLLGYFAFSGAMLTKGPVGIILPSFIFFLYLWKTNQLSRWKEMYILPGFLMVLLISLPWFILVNRQIPGYLYFFFVRENFLRYFTHVHHRTEPFYFYIPIILIGLFPWIFFLPASLKKTFKNQYWTSWWNDSARLFCVIWFSVGFLFFTMSGSKLATYIFPYFAPLALLIANYWDRQFSEITPNYGLTVKWLAGFSFLIAFILTITGIFIPVESFPQKLSKYLWWPMTDEAIVLFILGFLVLYFHRIRKIAYSFAVISLCSLFLVTDLLLDDAYPKIVEHKTFYSIASQFNSILHENDQIYSYQKHPLSMVFYLKPGYKMISTDSINHLAKIMDHPHQSYAILYKMDDYSLLEAKTLRELHLIYKDHDGRLIVSN